MLPHGWGNFIYAPPLRETLRFSFAPIAFKAVAVAFAFLRVPLRPPRSLRLQLPSSLPLLLLLPLFLPLLLLLR